MSRTRPPKLSAIALTATMLLSCCAHPGPGGWRLWIYRAADSRAELSDDEISAIVRVVRRSREPSISSKRVVRITIYARDRVSVSTGYQRGPLNGGGDAIELVRQDGAWVIERVRSWES